MNEVLKKEELMKKGQSGLAKAKIKKPKNEWQRYLADNVIKKEWQRYKPNNWLKLHGIPMRRKPIKKQRAYFITDEFHSMFDQDKDKLEILKIPEAGIDEAFVRKVTDTWNSVHKSGY